MNREIERLCILYKVQPLERGGYVCAKVCLAAAEMSLRRCVKTVAVFPHSGRAALPLSGGSGGVGRGGGPLDRGAAEAGGRGEEDPHQAVLLWGQV